MILNEIQTNRRWDSYGSDPTPSPTPTTHTGGILLTLISMNPNVLHLKKKCYPLTSVM